MDVIKNTQIKPQILRVEYLYYSQGVQFISCASMSHACIYVYKSLIIAMNIEIVE